MTSLVAADPVLNAEYDIGYYTYPTTRWRWPFEPKSLSITELAQALKTELENQYCDYEEVVLVCHSLGGVIARKYVIEELKASRLLRVRKILLYAVPHNGAELARWGSAISWHHRHLRQLRKNSEFIEAVKTDWEALQCASKIQAKNVIGGQDTVVDRGQDQFRGAEMVAHLDHRTIITPKLSTETPFVILRRFLGTDGKLSAATAAPTSAKPDDAEGGAHAKPNVLFDRYTPAAEQYYIERREDIFVAANLPLKSLWLTGISGLGKTAALVRAFSKAQARFRVISLGLTSGGDIKEIFRGIHELLALELGSTETLAPDVGWLKLTSSLSALLELAWSKGISWILIDELPLSDDAAATEFLSRLMSVITFSSHDHFVQKATLVCSSVYDPRPAMQNASSKVHELIKVAKISPWRTDDAGKLIALIVSTLNLSLTDLQQQTLITAAGGSPRFIKVFFLNYVSAFVGSLDGFSEALAQTQAELAA